MIPIEVDLTVSFVSEARTEHACAYCKRSIKKKEHYTKITARKKGLRFPRTLAVCKSHEWRLIPLSVILDE